MKYSNIPLAQSVVAYCETYQIRHVVISPGSRNAPLTIGFSYNPYFECYSIVDERCAAFFALGIAQQRSEPVALVCTSGSALLNYYPAIAEAYFSRIPLVVLSADRPEHLIGIGDGQTIYQEGVYEKHIFYSANLRSDGTQEAMQFNAAEIEKAICESILNSGPVHINVPFNEPLYGMTSNNMIEPIQKLNVSIRDEHSEDQLNSFRELWKTSQRKMILIGVLDHDALSAELIKSLADDHSLVVFTETTSNVHNNNFFPSIDKIIAPLDDKGFQELQPDFLITMGGLIISKKIKAFLRSYAPKEHWHIGSFEANDTFFKLSEVVKSHPDTFLKLALEDITGVHKSGFRDNWLKVKEQRTERHRAYMDIIPFSDLLAFNYLLKYLNKEVHLQLSNSSTIRYAQLFDWRSDVQMYCNRGTSGIDGSTSTAIGAAVARKDRATVLVTGDLSFFYDSNALWNNYTPKSFKIVLINNQGGGIFRILPGHKDTENFDRFFETRHELTAKELCDMYGFKYSYVASETHLSDELNSFFKYDNRPALIEIVTPVRENDQVLLDYFEFMK